MNRALQIYRGYLCQHTACFDELTIAGQVSNLIFRYSARASAIPAPLVVRLGLSGRLQSPSR
jgi:hypothetical protein